MNLSSGRTARAALAIRWLVVVCLALVSFLAAVQVLHFHEDDLAPVARHCPICQVLHSPAVAALSSHLEVALQTTHYECPIADFERKSILELSALYSRPPPLS